MAANENGNASWQDWSRHVLAELKRLNGNIESIEVSIGEIKTSLAVQDVFIQDAKDKDIMDQVSKNTLFRNNTNKLIWKIIGGTVISGGGITFLVNFLANLGNSTAGGG